ncbi:putative L-asparaginase [Polaromonas vacuolata]|uniref:Putative L-asparaginase n=1 Tax=Polaromonas vacuolata TaxID=37448 RepID=A0A6H2H8Y2_9BURK|nr:asparaginase [Polaromonas vacuolata]QJC56342.1 putative L-asparaginase [Polaromonas vacuolata]
MQTKKIVILGTGGTIAGTAASSSDNIGYTAAELGVDQLVQAIPSLSSLANIHTEQVAQLDSKDMSFTVWAKLADRIQHYLDDSTVDGIVITHGTDTLEETAYFLQVLLNPGKPVVMTCAMRPASSLAPDGPQNVLDAASVALHTGAFGVMVVCSGVVHSALEVQKVHTYQLDAFSSGDAGPLGYVEEGAVRQLRAWPLSQRSNSTALRENISAAALTSVWPRIEILMNYTGADGLLVQALCQLGVAGLVIAGTGNGTIHHALEAALLNARDQGVLIMRATRCVNGRVLARADDALEDSHGLSPVKARIELWLRLLS